VLTTYQGLVDDLTRDDAGKVSAAQRDQNIALAVERYSSARPRDAVEDVVGAGTALPLPAGYQVGFSDVMGLEYPAGRVPPVRVASDRWEMYLAPGGLEIMLLDAVAGSVRVAYTVRHQLDAVTDTIPTKDREAVAKYAAALACEQLASFYASDTDSTIGADRAQGQSRSQAFAARAREYRKQFEAALGVTDQVAAPASAVAQLRSDDSFGQPRLFHPRRFIR
jgi:hypothetical protein